MSALCFVCRPRVLSIGSSPLCVEEFDLSDKNFKPCPCGYQVRVPW